MKELSYPPVRGSWHRTLVRIDWLFPVLAVVISLILLRAHPWTAPSDEAGLEREAQGAFQRTAQAASSDEDLAIRRIGWVPTLDDAFALARATGRPVLMVAQSGDICTGRV